MSWGFASTASGQGAPAVFGNGGSGWNSVQPEPRQWGNGGQTSTAGVPLAFGPNSGTQSSTPNWASSIQPASTGANNTYVSPMPARTGPAVWGRPADSIGQGPTGFPQTISGTVPPVNGANSAGRTAPVPPTSTYTSQWGATTSRPASTSGWTSSVQPVLTYNENPAPSVWGSGSDSSNSGPNSASSFGRSSTASPAWAAAADSLTSSNSGSNWGNTAASTSQWGNTATSTSQWGNTAASTNQWGNTAPTSQWGNTAASTSQWGAGDNGQTPAWAASTLVAPQPQRPVSAVDTFRTQNNTPVVDDTPSWAMGGPTGPVGGQIWTSRVAASSTATPVELKPVQYPWSYRIGQILQVGTNGRPWPGYIDVSEPGAGKTIMAIDVAKKLGVPIFVICPVAAHAVWIEKCRLYGQELVDVITYQAASSANSSGTGAGGKWIVPLQPTKGRGKRSTGTTNVDGTTQVAYGASFLWREQLLRGIMVIIDEAQEARSVEAIQSQAITILLNTINNPDPSMPRSYYAILSGSPIDDPADAESMLRLVGMLPHDRPLYTTAGRNHIFNGIQTLVDKCYRINPEKTGEQVSIVSNALYINKFDQGFGLASYGELSDPRTYMNRLTFLLFLEVVKPCILGAMPKEESQFATIRLNAFYRMSDERTFELENKLADMNLDQNKNKLFSDLGEIQRIKVDLFIRLIRKELAEGRKVIWGGWHLKVIGAIYDVFAQEMDVVILTGEDSDPVRRGEAVYKFNNSPTHNLLLMMIKVGGASISLHDQLGPARGGKPRTMILSPGYEFIALYQATQRIERVGVMSDTKVIIAYALTRYDDMQNAQDQKRRSREWLIMASTSGKAAVTSQVVRVEGVKPPVMPDSYPTWIEKPGAHSLM